VKNCHSYGDGDRRTDGQTNRQRRQQIEIKTKQTSQRDKKPKCLMAIKHTRCFGPERETKTETESKKRILSHISAAAASEIQ